MIWENSKIERKATVALGMSDSIVSGHGWIVSELGGLPLRDGLCGIVWEYSEWSSNMKDRLICRTNLRKVERVESPRRLKAVTKIQLHAVEFEVGGCGVDAVNGSASFPRSSAAVVRWSGMTVTCVSFQIGMVNCTSMQHRMCPSATKLPVLKAGTERSDQVTHRFGALDDGAPRMRDGISSVINSQS